jgi:hypothetical protein
LQANCSRRVEGDVQEFGWGFAVLQALSDDSERQSLNSRDGFIAVLGVTHDAWERRHFGEPPAVRLAFEFDREGHVSTVLSARLANKRLHPAAAARRSREFETTVSGRRG